jgi:hypothetical protein
MSRRYTTKDLMAAIVDLSEATAHGFASLRNELRSEMDSRFDTMALRFDAMDRRFEKLEYTMNKRFDSVDLRFDAFERRLHVLES